MGDSGMTMAAVDGERKPALQVIVLGSGGGPREDNITAFLVRSTNEGWVKGSLLAVDAGVHLAAITRILEDHPSHIDSVGNTILSNGPFEGLSIPNKLAKANAAYITRVLVETYLITHPHLDHITGFVVNTAALPGTRPKRIAALPKTIDAFKKHIFNNIIWPNLSDENNGAGLVTYMRLVEGGSPALGDGEGRGYVEVCEGLSVKACVVSHGHCIERHAHRSPSISGPSTNHSPHLGPVLYPPNLGQIPRSPSLSVPGTHFPPPPETDPDYCVTDSSAYFIRDITTGREVLVFGDVEPDSLSLNPRNFAVWQEAAPKIAANNLNGILIECSYDESQSNDHLFGHLKPSFLMEEIETLAMEVAKCRTALMADSKEGDSKKRKRNGGHLETTPASQKRPNTSHSTISLPINSHDFSSMSSSPWPNQAEIPLSPKSQAAPAPIKVTTSTKPSTQTNLTHSVSAPAPAETEKEEEEEGSDVSIRGALKGLKVVIIHVKERLDDGPLVCDTIREQLDALEAVAQTGVEWHISSVGEGLYF